MEEEQRLGVDTNCQRKSITVLVTVVLGLVRLVARALCSSIKPAPDELFLFQVPSLRPQYMHFGKHEGGVFQVRKLHYVRRTLGNEAESNSVV
jgi:hypothetical protein